MGVWFIILIIFLFFLLVLGDFTSVSKSELSENDIVHIIERECLPDYPGKILTNIYIPKPSGETTEIDVLYITRKGLVVIEDKNFAGYIFGKERNPKWTVTLYSGRSFLGFKKVEKHNFYNPIWQNNSHIKYLREYLNCHIKAFSIITFSNRGELKDVVVDSLNTYVCLHSNFSEIILDTLDGRVDKLTDEQIEKFYNKLLPLSNSDEEVINKHISDIQYKLNSTKTCPICGGKLVIRTAQKGRYIGKQFYGCSNYPKCKYKKNI